MNFEKPIHKEAFRYYALGLNTNEISKLLEKSPRTIKNWITLYKFKNRLVANEMRQNGAGLQEIAEKLKISKEIALNWIL